jgi:hypothetical protein
LAARARAVNEFDERIVIEKTLGVDGELVGPWDATACGLAGTKFGFAET